MVFAMMECDIYHIVDAASAPTQCISCSNAIFGCLICTNRTNCALCVIGFIVDGKCANVSHCSTVT